MGVGIGEFEPGVDQIVAVVDIKPVEIQHALEFRDNAHVVFLEKNLIGVAEIGVDGSGIGHAGTAARDNGDSQEFFFADLEFLELFDRFIGYVYIHF